MDIDVTQESAEFREGGRAYHDMTGRGDCPYLVLMRGAIRRDPDEVKATDWLRGWDFAWRADMAARRERWSQLPKYPSFGAW